MLFEMCTLPVDGVDEIAGFGQVDEEGDDECEFLLFFAADVGDCV